MFNTARLKLTAWYLLTIMLVSFLFSGVIYRVQTAELERFERRVIILDLVSEAKQRLFFYLLEINTGIFVMAGALGFFLAGRTLRPIQDMVEEQNRFIGDASHELRTPLTSLKTAIEVNLRDKDLTINDAKKILDQSLGQVNKLQRLTENLLDLSRSASSIKETVSLREVVLLAIERVKPLAKKITIKNLVKDGEIFASKEDIVNLLVILLDNAIKYSEAKGTITIDSKNLNRQIVLTVKDQGIGISQEDLPKVFDRFYRADTAREKNGMGGYGLGLSIAKKIIEAHNGAINIASQVGKGTVVTVKFQ